MSVEIFGASKYKITFEYNGEKTTFDVEPYKTLRQAKQKALSILYLCPKDARCYFFNRDITDAEGMQIGTYFKGKKNIEINLKTAQIILPSSGDLFLTNPEIIVERPVETNVISPTNTIKNQSNEITKQNNCPTTAAIKRELKILNSDSLTKSFRCVKCKEGAITNFCRNCRVFICKRCRMSPTHQNHANIFIDKHNLEESLKYFAMLLQSEIESNIVDSNYLKKSFSEDNQGLDTTKQKEIMNKLIKINSRFNTVILYMLKKQKEGLQGNDVNNVVDDYNKSCGIISNELQDIVTEIDKKYKDSKISLKQFFYYFDLIKQSEDKLNKLGNNVQVLKIYNELDARINIMYKKINSAIDELMNDEKAFQIVSEEEEPVPPKEEEKKEEPEPPKVEEVKKEEPKPKPVEKPKPKPVEKPKEEKKEEMSLEERRKIEAEKLRKKTEKKIQEKIDKENNEKNFIQDAQIDERKNDGQIDERKNI